jgi:hypothetical protein
VCKDADVDYWMGAEVPVLLVCSHPNTGEAWWMRVQAWFTDPAHRASGRVDFDKSIQRFDASAAPLLLNLADPPCATTSRPTATGTRAGRSPTTTTTTTSTYDNANRVTNSGYSYDQLGRTLTVPSAELASGNGALTITYYDSDKPSTLIQGTA